MSTQLTHELIDRLAEIRALVPEMRLGQLLATIELLADDAGHSMWEIEDPQLAEVLERLRGDLAKRAG